MEEQKFTLRALSEVPSPTLRDLVDTAFRHRRLMMACLAAILIVPVIAALVLPRYRGEMKFLVVRERVDPVVTPAAEKDSLAVVNTPVVSEPEINSEVELLNSHELLRAVVVKTGLAHGAHWWGWWRSNDEKIEAAVRSLDSSLDVDPVRKTNVIAVTYKNKDPQVAAQVMNEIARLYLEKHRDVHRFPGQFEFFQHETDQYRKGLQQTELQLADFPRKYGAVSPALDRDLTLQKLNDFQAAFEQTRAAMAETKERIRELQSLGTTTPPRMTTQLRTSDNPQLLEMMKSTALNLELKRSQLLNKFQPDYRPVQEVEKELAQTRAAIANEEKSPIQEQTTDVDPVKEWIRSELAKSQADLEGLQARAKVTENTVRVYQTRASALERNSLAQADLLRTAKAQENNYLLYLNKQEEARITDALDQTRILNVAMAEEPTVPALPFRPPLAYAGVTFLGMILLTVGCVWTLHQLDGTVRSPAEVEHFLNTRILAAVPYNDDAIQETNGKGNGNGNGNGNHHYLDVIQRAIRDLSKSPRA